MERFYFSLAAGSQHKTARILNYPYILINYMTQTNKPPRYEYKSLFTDSGGFHSSLKHGGYTKTDEEYLEYVEKYEPEFFALRDYPCEPELLKTHNRTVEDHIEMTLQHHLQLIDKLDDYNITSTPVPVLQGWRIEDYLKSIDLYKEHGLISDYMAIGSVCRRHQDHKIKRVINNIRNNLPRSTRLHGFGVKISVLKDKSIWDALWSVDSGAWDYAARWEKIKQGVKGSDLSIVEGQRYWDNINYLRCFHEGQTELCFG